MFQSAMRGAMARRVRIRPSVRPQRVPATDLVLPPPTMVGQPAGLVLIPGLNISSKAYAPLLLAMQRAAAQQGLALFAGCAHFDWEKTQLRQPEDLQERIDGVAGALRRAGLAARAPVFHGAHSLSTVFLQDYLAKRQGTAGQILLGASLLRKHCYPVFAYDVPTLTVHAELDGEEHVMRQAEQYSLQHGLDQAKFPLVVLEGQTHMQFASGERPAHMRQELPPAVREQVAHEAIGEVVVDFIRVRLGERSAGLHLQRRFQNTKALLFPALMSQEHVLQPALSL